jgi:hypothetical protein
MVSHLGVKASNYAGEVFCPASGGAWTAFVQSANVFAFPPDCGLTTNFNLNSGTLYEKYAAYLLVPTSTCSGSCNTATWAGIGGTVVNVTGFGSIESSLIQSGLNMTATNVIRPFIDYAPASIQTPTLPTGDTYSTGDTMVVWGWAANDPSCAQNSTGAYACFGIANNSKGWAYYGSPSMTIPAPSGSNWLPATAEYAAERVSHSNANYDYDLIEGDAWDSTGAIHPDPGASGTDYYLYTQQQDSNNQPYSTAEWYNGTLNSPMDPIVLIFQNSQ